MLPLTTGCFLMDGKFLMFPQQDGNVELVCQGYLTNPTQARTLCLTTEPTERMNLFTVWTVTEPSTMNLKMKGIQECFNVLAVWEAPGYMPMDVNYPKMQRRITP